MERHGIGNRGAEADAAQLWREALESGHGERQLVAALGGCKGVDFVDDDRFKACEHCVGLGVGQQQGEAFGGGEQDVRRIGTLAGLFVGAGVAGAGFDSDGEFCFGDGCQQIALNIDGQGFEGADVEGVQAFARGCGECGEGGEEASECFASAGGGNEQRMLARTGGGEHGKLVHARLPPARCEPAQQRWGNCGDYWQGAALRIVERVSRGWC